MNSSNKISKEEYVDYMRSLKNSIFKILPLYEEEVSTLSQYISFVIFEVFHVRHSTSYYNGAWLTRTQGILEGLIFECNIKDNKDFIKYVIFSLLDSIDKQIVLTVGE